MTKDGVSAAIWTGVDLFAYTGFAVELTVFDKEIIVKTIKQLDEATIKKDVQTLADHTFDRLVQAVGGREKYIQSITTGLTFMETQGLKLVSHRIDSPADATIAGDFLITTVTESTVFASKNGSFVVDGFQLAVRKNTGGAWSFVGGGGLSQNPNALSVLLPELPKGYKLPKYTTSRSPG